MRWGRPATARKSTAVAHELRVETGHLELDAFRRSVDRRLWLGMGLLAVVALGALCVALALAVRPMPVVAFDGTGRPIVFRDTRTPALEMDELRVKAFVTDFLKAFVALDSSRIDEDLAASTAMMTPRFRRVFLADQAAVERRAQFRQLRARARLGKLTFRIAPFRADDVTGQIYVMAYGPMVLRPLNAGADDDRLQRQHILVRLVLQRAPVSDVTIHGLMVDAATVRLFDTNEALRIELLKGPQ